MKRVGCAVQKLYQGYFRFEKLIMNCTLQQHPYRTHKILFSTLKLMLRHQGPTPLTTDVFGTQSFTHNGKPDLNFLNVSLKQSNEFENQVLSLRDFQNFFLIKLNILFNSFIFDYILSFREIQTRFSFDFQRNNSSRTKFPKCGLKYNFTKDRIEY